MYTINSLTTRDEIAEFSNSVDLDEMAHNEPSHLDLFYLPSTVKTLNIGTPRPATVVVLNIK